MSDLRTKGNQNFKEKQDAKIERALELSKKNAKLSDQTYSHAKKMASVIPFGQPILVRHHSEKRDRRYRAKIENNFNKSIEQQKKSEYYADKAQTIGKGGILSDDPEAIIKLKEKLETLENRREIFKEFNKYQKKYGTVKAIEKFKNDLRQRDIQTITWQGQTIGNFIGWPLTNLGAKIRETKKRIERIKKMDSMTINFTVNDIEVKEEGGYINVYFPDKPNDETRAKIKGYGIALKWSRYKCCWTRKKTASTGEWFIEDLKKVLENTDY